MKKNTFKLFASVALTTCAWQSPLFCSSVEAKTMTLKQEKPIIGLNLAVVGDKPTNYEISRPYTQAVIKAGGIPILIPPMPKKNLRQLLKGVDGVLMIGGRDYPPALYGKKTHKSIVEMHKVRTKFDQMLVQEVINNKKLPFLGICAGAQILNIKNGGSLVRDIPSRYPKSKLKHASPKGWLVGFNKHKINFEKDCYLAQIYGRNELKVPSSHHQCVDKAGKGLKITARSPDGAAESIESESKERFMVGVQWHPERDYKKNKPLFKQFIRSCQNYRQDQRI